MKHLRRKYFQVPVHAVEVLHPMRVGRPEEVVEVALVNIISLQKALTFRNKIFQHV